MFCFLMSGWILFCKFLSFNCLFVIYLANESLHYQWFNCITNNILRKMYDNPKHFAKLKIVWNFSSHRNIMIVVILQFKLTLFYVSNVVNCFNNTQALVLVLWMHFLGTKLMKNKNTRNEQKILWFNQVLCKQGISKFWVVQI